MSAFAEDKESDYGTVKKVRFARARVQALRKVVTPSSVSASTASQGEERVRRVLRDASREGCSRSGTEAKDDETRETSRSD